jgi:hypothetical protein
MNDQVSRQALFQKVLARLLKPIAKIMIAYNMTLNAAIDALKRALYDAATSENDKITDSRVSLLTGLHRKDVRRLRENPSERGKRSLINPASLVIGIWLTHEKFQNEIGSPSALRRQGNKETPGFNDLVRISKVDIPVSTLLDALIEEKIIEYKKATDQFVLVKGAFLATTDDSLMLDAFEKNLAAHLDAASGNLLKDQSEKAFFERALHVNKLSEKSVEKLEFKAQNLMQDILETLNKEALTLQEQDANDKHNNQRFSVGAYIFCNDKKTIKSEENRHDASK